MSSLVYQYKKTPIGEICIGVFQDKLVLCDWRYRRMRSSIDKRIVNSLHTTMEEKVHPLIDESFQQIQEYLQQERQEFNLPYHLIGSPFQIEVWNALRKIPYGSTLSYLALAQKIDNEKAIRAVATANGANALAIIIPCHRVIGKNGELVGYAGGLQAKKKLLDLEGALPKVETLSLFE